MDTSELAATLLQAQNADGGWGYYVTKTSRLEPTVWAALALQRAGTLHAVSAWPSRHGMLLERAGGEPNTGFHGLALLALLSGGVEHALGNATLMEALHHARGLSFGPSPINRQDNSLRGWSWVTDTFSWVEPTACCLLALKQWRRRSRQPTAADQIDEAERLLADRVCKEGGWNYGNSNMLGAELHPYVPTTALALLAMQDQPDEPAVIRSLAWLERHALSEPSGSALALAAIALAVCGRNANPVRAALLDRLEVTAEVGNHANMATALYALEHSDGYAAFTL